ncbi:L-aspartate oxidase [Psychrobacter alimentarius]|uniref:L-aspartate oxidase n=1 Tax=Psychrobacter alimentarius TaxID=261164 RepID=UPI003FCFFC57
MSSAINLGSVIGHMHSKEDIRQTDVLIIGAGLAGLSTALSLPKSLTITVLSKSALEICSSHYAQGGIAASLDEEDTIADHIADTLVAGAGLCEVDNTAHILSAGQQAVEWLCQQGVPFTQIPDSDTQRNTAALHPRDAQTSNLHLTKEGGHGRRRVAHADDATGRYIMEALLIKAQAASNITILPYHEALALLTAPFNSHLNNTAVNHCYGAHVFDHTNQRRFTFHSSAVVLASGGLGQLFKRASAPDVCVGDGVIMAWEAGCRLANLEFVQFHPTGLALGDSRFLISEALRGEGGRLYCPRTGTRFMLDIDARAELAPRDIVARAIAEQIDSNGLGYVHLDVSHLPAAFLKAHFPQIYQTLQTLGIDMTAEPIPVAPITHYSCGGVVTSADGLTDVIGLYAAGEVAYTGLHGANRLASNSLLECVVVGRHIALHLPQYLTAVTEYNSPLSDNSSVKPAFTAWALPCLTNTQSVALSPSPSRLYANEDITNTRCNVGIDIDVNVDVVEITTALKLLMTNNMGIVRHADKLKQALLQVQQWQQALHAPSDQKISILSKDRTESHSPNRTDLNCSNSVDESAILHSLAYFQLKQQLSLASLIIQSAYQRCESRGGHARLDYPDTDSEPRTSVVYPIVALDSHRIDKPSRYHGISTANISVVATKIPAIG